MAKTNYTFAKRQRELAKKRKKEEKRSRPSSSTGDQPEGEPLEPGTDPTAEGAGDESASDAEPGDKPASDTEPGGDR